MINAKIIHSLRADIVPKANNTNRKELFLGSLIDLSLFLNVPHQPILLPPLSF